MNKKELPPYDSFFSELCNFILIEKDYNDFDNLTTSGLSSEQAVFKLRLNKIAPTGDEYLRSTWVSEGMIYFKEFFMWYKNKDVVPTQEAMQKMIEIYHQKEIDMLKLGCTLLKSANTCLDKSTDSKFYPFTESDKALMEKIREVTVGGPSIVITRKAVVDETFIRKSTKLCQAFADIDASRFSPYSICQPMHTALYTRRNYDSESQNFMPRQNKTRSLENMGPSYFQQTRPKCKIGSNVTTGRQKKVDCFSVDGICNHCNTVFEAKGCYFHYCLCQEARPSSTDNEIKRGTKRREQDQMRRDYTQQKGCKFFEMWKCNWWVLY